MIVSLVKKKFKLKSQSHYYNTPTRRIKNKRIDTTRCFQEWRRTELFTSCCGNAKWYRYQLLKTNCQVLVRLIITESSVPLLDIFLSEIRLHMSIHQSSQGNYFIRAAYTGRQIEKLWIYSCCRKLLSHKKEQNMNTAATCMNLKN